jgi:hypothetical protein
VNCAIVDLMFLSFYFDYIVDEFSVIFCIFFTKFSLKLLIFGGLSGQPKIRSTILAGIYFRRPGNEPPKIDYFRRPGISRRK